MQKAEMTPNAWVYAGLYEGKKRRVKARVEQQRNIPKIAMGAVCTSFGVLEEEMTSKTRLQIVAFARHAYCSMLRKFTRLTLREIGELLGDRNHATVLNSVKVAENLIEYDDQFRQSYDEALELIIDECGLLAHIPPRK